MEEYIIIWRYNYLEPVLHCDNHGFIEKFSDYHDALAEAEANDETGMPEAFYIDYKIVSVNG